MAGLVQNLVPGGVEGDLLGGEGEGGTDHLPAVRPGGEGGL